MCNISLIAAFLLYLCFDHASMLVLRSHQLMFRGNGVTFVTAEKDWDFLMFTQEWPSTRCKVWTHNKPNHHCTFPKNPDAWTVHGIWPTKEGTRGPFNCNNTWRFDPEQVRPIESELEQVWTNIEKETQIYDLWAHEWNKHGTCAASLEPFNSQLKYFSKGIEFLKKYHMNDMLKAADIVPSDIKEFSAEDINKAVVSKINVRPFIACDYINGVQYLSELRICFDKELNLMECLKDFEVDGLLTTCNTSTGIMYPTEAPPKRSLVQLYKFVNWVQWFTL